jgi:hypothetical protein
MTNSGGKKSQGKQHKGQMMGMNVKCVADWKDLVGKYRNNIYSRKLKKPLILLVTSRDHV